MSRWTLGAAAAAALLLAVVSCEAAPGDESAECPPADTVELVAAYKSGRGGSRGDGRSRVPDVRKPDRPQASSPARKPKRRPHVDLDVDGC